MRKQSQKQKHSVAMVLFTVHDQLPEASEGERAVSLNVFFFVKKIGENGAIDHVPDLGREDLPFCVACCRSKSIIPFKRNSENAKHLMETVFVVL